MQLKEGDDPKSLNLKRDIAKIKVDLSPRISRNGICPSGVLSRDLINASCQAGSFQELH